MKHSKKIAIVSAAFVCAVVVVLLLLGNLKLPFMEAGVENPEATKVKRPAPPRNASVVQLVTEGDTALRQGDLTGALAYYERASQKDRRDPVLHEKVGDVYLAQKNFPSAVEAFEKGQEANPEAATSPGTITIKLVKGLLGMRKIVEAKVEAEKVKPDTQASLLYRGLIAAFLNEQNNAKELLTKSITAGADESLKGAAQKVLSSYRDFELSRDAPVEYLQVLLAQTFDNLGEYGLSIELAFDAIKTKPDYRDAWIVLGHGFLNQEKFLDAEDAFGKALELDSTSSAAFFYRGITKKYRALYPQKDIPASRITPQDELIKGAVSDFKSALTAGWQPKISAKVELADLYFGLGDYANAFPLYRDIVTTDPSDVSRFTRPIALAINYLKQPKEALALAQKAYQTHPQSAVTENLLGWASLVNNDFVTARQHLMQALQKDPKFIAAYLNLAQVAEKEGNRAEALAYYQKIIDQKDAPEIMLIKTTAQNRSDKLKQGGTTLNTQVQNRVLPIIEAPSVDTQRKIPSLNLL